MASPSRESFFYCNHTYMYMYRILCSGTPLIKDTLCLSIPETTNWDNFFCSRISNYMHIITSFDGISITHIDSQTRNVPNTHNKIIMSFNYGPTQQWLIGHNKRTSTQVHTGTHTTHLYYTSEFTTAVYTHSHVVVARCLWQYVWHSNCIETRQYTNRNMLMPNSIHVDCVYVHNSTWIMIFHLVHGNAPTPFYENSAQSCVSHIVAAEAVYLGNHRKLCPDHGHKPTLLSEIQQHSRKFHFITATHSKADTNGQ